MRNTTVLFLLLTLVIRLNSQTESINIPCSTAPLLDGHVSTGEWANADSISLPINSVKSVKVYFMCDRDNLFFLFAGNLESQIRFPEILLDMNNSKSATWQSDDWWFHVSATDCENQGTYGVYSNCLLVQPDWIGVNNITQGSPLTDTVEIAIPFNKIKQTSGILFNVGICFNLFNITNATNTWPPSANIQDPSTWANATLPTPLCEPTTLTEENTFSSVQVFPNPGNGKITVNVRGKKEYTYGLALFNLNGQLIHSQNITNQNDTHVELNASPGIYFLKIHDGRNYEVRKVIVY